MTSALHALAEAAGVAVRWTDAFGHPREVGDESLRAVLRSLGFASDSTQDCEASLSAIAHDKHTGQLPPLLTAQAGRPVALPEGALAGMAHYRVILESGEIVNGALTAGRELAALPIGYHRLEAGDQVATLAVAPAACWRVEDSCAQASPASANAGAPWGIAAQLYSLRRVHDGGLAEYTALAALAQAAAAQGASALAVSPVHAMFSAVPGRFSPYGPSSRLFFNVLHIDPARVMGEPALAKAMAALPADDAVALASLETGSLVNWPVVGRLRLTLLRHLYEQFTVAQGLDDNEHADAYRRLSDFTRDGGQALERHARFEALDAWLAPSSGQAASGDWRQWPAAYHDPDGAAVHDFAAAQANEVAFHRFLQWQAAEGLQHAQASATSAGMAIGLIADLAVGADPGGSQAWSLQSAMLKGLSVGAPPDLLAPQGQGWGLGALSPRALQAQGFAPWIAMLRANMRHGGGIRIDHILGLMRLWLVPDGGPASAGAYVRYPFTDMLRLVALESHRHRAIVIGEDLGTVPEGFSDTLAGAGVLGIRVLWFQRQGQRFMHPSQWPKDAMATTSTHDLATIAGWWSGRDIAWRDRLGFLGDATLQSALAERESEKQALWDVMRSAPDEALPNEPPVTQALAFTASTPAALMMAPLEDVLGLVEQPNLPGTVDVHPNWQQRLPDDACTLLDQPVVQQRLAALRHARGDIGTTPCLAKVS